MVKIVAVVENDSLVLCVVCVCVQSVCVYIKMKRYWNG